MASTIRSLPVPLRAFSSPPFSLHAHSDPHHSLSMHTGSSFLLSPLCTFRPCHSPSVHAQIPIAALHLPSFASFLGRHLLSSVAILHDQSPKLQKPFRQCLSAGPFSCLLADQDRGPLGNRDLSRFPQTEITSATTLCLLSCSLENTNRSKYCPLTVSLSGSLGAALTSPPRARLGLSKAH